MDGEWQGDGWGGGPEVPFRTARVGDSFDFHVKITKFGSLSPPL
jgi:hypothetical protein